MLYADYIKIRNFTRLHNFYGPHEKQSDYHDIWGERAIHLITAMCQLEDENIYPKSALLDDLIEFTEKYPEATRLRRYLDEIPGKWDSGNKAVSIESYQAHGFLIHCLYNIKLHSSAKYKKCSVDMTGDFKFKCNEFGYYKHLEIVINDKIIKIEHKGQNYHENHFLINGILTENLEFDKLVNLISFAKYVKEINIENTQAAYYFLS